MKRLLVCALLAAGLWLWLQDAPSPVQPHVEPDHTAQSGALVMADVSVRDVDGSMAWRGDVDLGPVLERIARGERDPHRNDGAQFHNRERRLPVKPGGHYREYVVRTPGMTHAGPQRLVIGRDGEVWYTPDHYQTFRRVR